jgi:hypothetical protein
MKQTTTITKTGVVYALQEMNNPLTTILLCVDELIPETDEASRGKYGQAIKESALRIQQSIKDICNFLNEQSKDTSADNDFAPNKLL